MNRQDIMDFMRREDIHEILTNDDCLEIFTGILPGSSDCTRENFEAVCNHFGMESLDDVLYSGARPISSVSREDIASIELTNDGRFDASKIDDTTLQAIADKMGSLFNEYDYWPYLTDVCDLYNIPKIKK